MRIECCRDSLNAEAAQADAADVERLKALLGDDVPWQMRDTNMQRGSVATDGAR